MRDFFKKLKEKYSIIILTLITCIIFAIIELFLFLDNSISNLFLEHFTRISLLGIFIILSLIIQYRSNKHKIVERKLRESEKKYRNAYKSTILYEDLFTHDVRNIFQKILSSFELSDLYSYNIDKKDELKEVINFIKDVIMRGKKLILNVEKLSHIEEGKILLSRIEVLEILNKTIEKLKESFSHKKINVTLESSHDEYYIKGNELLKSLVENVLINAIVHNENLIIEILIRISSKNKNGFNFIKLEFFDNGRGIPDSMKDTIFLRNYRKDEISTGIGLGLLLVKRIVEKFEGEIRVKDKIKGNHTRGSKFIVLIPEHN